MALYYYQDLTTISSSLTAILAALEEMQTVLESCEGYLSTIAQNTTPT